MDITGDSPVILSTSGRSRLPRKLRARQKKGLDVVETVLALAQDVESKVDFDVGLKCHLQSVLHLAIALTAASTVAVTCSRHGRPVSSYSGKAASTGATKEIICRILASSSGMPLVRM